MADLKAIIGKIAGGARLSRAEAEDAFNAIMSGEALVNVARAIAGGSGDII